MKNSKIRKILFTIICSLALNLSLVGSAFATDVVANGFARYSGLSGDWGIKSYNVDTFYIGNQYEGSGYQYVDGHDYQVWITSTYNPEIPRGSAQLLYLQMLNTSNGVVSTLYQSNFYDGSYRSFIRNPNSTYLVVSHSYDWLKSSSGTYRVKVDTYYENYALGMNGTASYYTPNF